MVWVDKDYISPAERRRLDEEEKRRSAEAAAYEEVQRRLREQEAARFKQAWGQIATYQWEDRRGAIAFNIWKDDGFFTRKPFRAMARQFNSDDKKTFANSWGLISAHALGPQPAGALSKWCREMIGSPGLLGSWSRYDMKAGETVWSFASERMRNEFVERWTGRIPSIIKRF